jgi:site-specific recombinase XerD
MLERYFVRPATIDRIHSCWIGKAIEQYVAWLVEQDYAAQNVLCRVPILVRFAEFTRSRGVSDWSKLPEYIEPFIEYWLKKQGKVDIDDPRRGTAARTIRNPIQQLVRLILPGYPIRGRPLREPFAESAPDFFSFLSKQRGLQKTTIGHYRHYLLRLDEYLRSHGIHALSGLSPAVLSAFITERGRALDKRSVQSLCSILKVFLRYLYSAGLHARDLSRQIESPRHYRLASLPRSISWDEVRQMLEKVDRRTPTGKRDFAILLLLVTYGLRAREVAALTLDDLDWKRERIHIPWRKAGHAAMYPLSLAVGEAVLAYLQHGRPRPNAGTRALFLRAFAPYTPLSWIAVSLRAKHYLRKAGIKVPRPGSHTLRHTCVQRLVDAHLSLKTIGDYIGHRTLDATKIYTKIDIERLREVALSIEDDIL